MYAPLIRSITSRRVAIAALFLVFSAILVTGCDLDLFGSHTFPLSLIDVSPVPGMSELALNSEVYARFNKDISSDAIWDSSIQITPAASYNIHVINAQNGEVLIVPTPNWRPRTTYYVTFTTRLRSTSGETLPKAVTLPFSTYPFRAWLITPLSGGSSVPRSLPGGISVSFSGMPDLGTAAAPRPAFSITPHISGSMRIQGSFYTIFCDSLEALTTYTVKIDSALRLPTGEQIEGPYVFAFTTTR